MAFLTLIAPLIAFTYPIDKIKDGTAQAFNKWFIEYLFNAILQPLHLLIYVILVGMSTELIKVNPLYAVVALAFISKAEKLMKDMFGLNKASTPPSPGAAMATGAIASKAFDVIKGKGSKALASGKSGGDSGGTPKSKIRQQSKGLEVYNNSSNRVEGKVEKKPNTAINNSNDNGKLGEKSGPWQKTNMSKEEYQQKFGDSVPWKLGEDSGPWQKTNLPKEEYQQKFGDNVPRKSNEQNSSSVQPKKEGRRKIVSPKNGRIKALALTGVKAAGKGLKYTGKKLGKGAIKTAAALPGAIIGGGIAIATGQTRYFTAGVGAGIALGGRISNGITNVPNRLKSIRTAYRKERLGSTGANIKESYEEFMKDKNNLKYIREQNPNLGLKNDRETKKYLEKNHVENYIGAGYNNPEDISRLMNMQREMGDVMNADQIMVADKMAASSGIKDEMLMDEEASLKFQKNLAKQIEGKNGITRTEAQEHARNHMNAMRVSRGLSPMSEKKEEKEKGNTGRDRNRSSDSRKNSSATHRINSAGSRKRNQSTTKNSKSNNLPQNRVESSNNTKKATVVKVKGKNNNKTNRKK